MRIATISNYALSSPTEPPQGRPFYGDTRRLLKYDVMLVVVEPVDGTHGIATAETSSPAMREYFEGGLQGTFVDVVNGTIADVLEGEPIEEVEDAHAILRDTDLPGRPRHETIPMLNVAPYDICGKQVGASVHELLADDHGIDPTTGIPLYASAGMHMEPEGYAEQAATVRDLGLFGYKYRSGIGPDGNRRTIELLPGIAGEMEAMFNVYTQWGVRGGCDREMVKDFVTFAAERDCCWVEEPVSPDDYAGYVDLAVTGAPLAGGESEPASDGLTVLDETGAVAFLQGDVRHHCGYTGCRPTIESCVGRDMELVLRNFRTRVGLLANVCLVAAAPEVSLLEYSVFEGDPLLNAETDPGTYPLDLTFDIIKGQPAVGDGVLSLSDEPGLGIEVSFDVLDDYPFRDGPWTEFYYDGD